MTLGGDSLSTCFMPFSPSSSSLPSSSPSSSSPISSSSVRMNRKFRSTKGASKARRDLINGEIRKLRALLPISAEERERLSYLHAMSIICTFIRKSVLLQTDAVSSPDAGLLPLSEDLLNALPGFIVAMTKEGKLLYISENVSQYLCLSMVDVLQRDSFYSMIHNNDTERVRFQLENNVLNTGGSCVCMFRCNRQWRPLLVKFRMFDLHRHLTVALCSPVPRESDSFITTHTPNMRYTGTTHSMVLHLGYEAEELIGRSWYSIIHPDDLLLSARGHTQLIHCEQVEMVLRVQNNCMNWVWLYIIANKESQSHKITCTNYVISEVEAVYLREKLCSTTSPSSPSPPSSASPQLSHTSRRSTKRPADGSTHSTRRKNRRVCGSTSEDNAYTSSPPYSPTSSLSPPLQELSHSPFPYLSQSYSPSFSSNSQSFSPSLSSSSQTFTYHSYSPDSASMSSDSTPLSSVLVPLPLSSEAVSLTAHSTPLSPPLYCYLSNHTHVPDIHAELSVSSTDSFLHLQNVHLLPPAQAGSERAFSVPEHDAPSDLLTPSPLSVQCYGETEQEVISVLAQQISSLASSFDSYRAKRSNHCYANTLCFQSHDSEAFLLDEDIIDSVLQVPQASLEVQALDTLLDLEMCSSSEHQSDTGFYVHTDYMQDGFPDKSMY